MPPRFAQLLFSSDPKVRLLLRYWSGSLALYLMLIAILQFQVLAGTAAAGAAATLTWYALGGMGCIFLLVRASATLGIAPSMLAVLQALFALSCTIGNYLVTGPLRGASLMIMLVVMVFCTFSLRPRPAMFLCAVTIAALGLTLGTLALRDPLHYPMAIESVHFAIAAGSLLAVTLLTGELSKLRASLKQQKTELLAALAQIRTLATIDELTCLANRRYMNEVLSAEERRQDGTADALCIALLDIDHFKQINDRYGHQAGDRVLRTLAALLRRHVRRTDAVGRSRP